MPSSLLPTALGTSTTGLQVPSLAALAGGAPAPTPETPATAYIDPKTGQLMIPGQTTAGPDGKPVAGPAVAYDPGVASYGALRQNDPGFFRPDGGGR